MFIRNKYSRCYFKIIKKAYRANRRKAEGQYYEAHHILPKSIYPVYANRKKNIVLLTPREHFVCHMLLTKCFGDKNSMVSMGWAFHRMAFSKNSKTSRALSSSEYALARKLHSKNMSGELHPSKTSSVWVDNVSQAVKNNWENSPERRQKTSERMSLSWKDNYDVLKEHSRIAGLKGSKISADLRRGNKYPGTGLQGKDNPASVHWTIVQPDGVTVEIYGGLKKYALQQGLSCDMLKRNGPRPEGYKGYMVTNNGKIRDKEASEK